jgi:hypothetical protein
MGRQIRPPVKPRKLLNFGPEMTAALEQASVDGERQIAVQAVAISMISDYSIGT